MKKALVISSIVICIGAVAFIYYMYYSISKSAYISSQSIEVTEIEVEDGEWVVKGLIDMEKEKAFIFHKGFNGVDYREEDGRFYVSLKYGVVSGEPADSFEVFLEDALDDVDQVFLQGDSVEVAKLVWEK